MHRTSIFFAVCLLITTVSHSFAQKPSGEKLYNPEANARVEIATAVAIAKQSHRNVLLQVGGNWCIWCVRLHRLIEGNDSLRSLLEKKFVFLPVNYDQNNANDPLWKDLGFPQRFGFPVLVVMDGNGRVIHIQNTAYLEEGKGHSATKVADFLTHWTVDAVSGKENR